MVKRSDLLDDSSYSFGSRDDFILNYRPTISFVEPEQIEEEFLPEEEPIIDTAKSRNEQIISGLNSVAGLATAIQKRIDQRVQAGGGLNIKLDPVKDHATVAAMKRRFPDRADPTVITYDDYKAVLDCLQKQAPAPQTISLADIQAAKSDPLRTDFGGYGNQQGENRPEISSTASSIQPVDLESFQKQALLSLFAMLRPLIIDEITKIIGL